MARASLTGTTTDLIQDSGSVLWSFVRGEQLEYPVTLSFLENALLGYTFEAVVIEADNVEEQGTNRPTVVKVGGAQTRLNVRVPPYLGKWQPNGAYNRGDIVKDGTKYYSLIEEVGYINGAPPSQDPKWEEASATTVYLQFPETLSKDWAVIPSVASPVYGFFELRVTEPENVNAFKRTWKPVRGMVEILFSPTDIVADL